MGRNGCFLEDGFGGGVGGQGTDDVSFDERLKASELDVRGGNLEAIEKERGLAVVKGGGEDATKHPLQGALDGVGVFQKKEVGGRRVVGG